MAARDPNDETGVTEKLVAVLAADVAGYSRLMQADRHATLAALDECRALFRDHITAQGGRIVDTAGDSVLAEFALATSAVQAAMAVQDALAARNQPIPDQRQMHFRIGIHVGEVLHKTDGTIYGDGVNIAARLESLCEPGAIAVSDMVRGAVHDRVSAQFVDRGAHEVKNISEPIHAYQVITPGAAGPSQAKARPVRKTALVAALAVVIAAASGGIWWTTRDSPPVQVTAEPDPAGATGGVPAVDLTIAVLPLENLSGDPEQGYFADGITDTLITDLSKLQNLGVIARNSTFAYKGQAVDVREIGRALGASHVLEGSIMQAGEQIRINVQLIDAVSGEHLWADRYDRLINDIFAVQDEIVGTVITKLNIEFASGERERLYRQTTDDPEAYDLFLRALDTQNRLTRTGNARAQELLQAALVVDPNFAAAKYLLAMTHYNRAIAGWNESSDETLDLSESLFLEAIELDDSLGPAYGFLGLIYLAKRQYDKALTHAARAIEISPGHAATLAYVSLVNSYSGRPERGLELIERAARLDPSAMWFAHPKGAAQIFLGDYQQAIASYRRCLAALSEFFWCNVNIIIPYMELEMIDEARAQARVLLRLNPTFDTETAVAIYRIRDPEVQTHWRTLLGQAGLP